MDEAKTVTEVRHARATAVVVGVGLPVLGGIGGWFLPGAVRWAVERDWFPWQGLFRFVGGLPDPWLGLGCVALGALAGLLLAGVLNDGALSVTVTGGEVVLRRGKHAVRLGRAEVAHAWSEDDHLVLAAGDGRELARQPSMLSAARMREALEGAGATWHERDPFLSDYRRWVPGTPGLADGVDALLRARARAIERQDHGDCDELRTELLRLGVVVRDQDGRQHVRDAPPVTTR